MNERWPDIPYQRWRDTGAALRLYAQVVGKYRLARTPWVNHSWHAVFYPSARGLTTGLVPDGGGGIEVSFDLIDHQVIGALRWTRLLRQFGGLAKVDRGCFYAANCSVISAIA